MILLLPRSEDKYSELFLYSQCSTALCILSPFLKYYFIILFGLLSRYLCYQFITVPLSCAFIYTLAILL